ncbi:MAG: hypothetical protein Q7V14_01830, partial [Coriobacteriia bacterium]|nr:hypothetical protein [Coriobacteriia bacterium]
RYFYVYTPPRPLGEIEADLEASEKRILELLGRVRKKYGRNLSMLARTQVLYLSLRVRTDTYIVVPISKDR